MRFRYLIQLCMFGLALSLLAPALRAADAPKFEIKDGDRIAYIGGTFVERDQDYSYLETLLTERYPDRTFTFRNLGWAGDTVTGQARAMFGKPEEGFNRLKSLVEQIKPTVVLVAYGMSESFDGPAKLPEFEKNYNAMLDMLAAAAAPGARFVLISPIQHEDSGRPLQDPKAHNASLIQYVESIKRIAGQRDYRFVNLFSWDVPSPYTFDGIQLTPRGYHAAGLVITAKLRVQTSWEAESDSTGKLIKSRGAKVEVALKHGLPVFSVAMESLPPPPDPSEGPNQTVGIGWQCLRISGLAPGNYMLKASGITFAARNAEDWAAGVYFDGGPAQDQAEALRKLIVAKNTDWFNRWRPANDTYLFGFRKHEQGRNAVEIPQFDPLIAQKEAEIAKAKVPQPVTYTLERQ